MHKEPVQRMKTDYQQCTSYVCKWCDCDKFLTYCSIGALHHTKESRRVTTHATECNENCYSQ